MLALVYFGLIYASQSLLYEMTGQPKGNPLALVASTLVIAALFQPLRTFIQRRIDKRFYRSKYNASKVVTDFTTTLHNVVDLAELQHQLIKAVEETMQPTHVSLWLLPAEQKNRPDRQVDEVFLNLSFDEMFEEKASRQRTGEGSGLSS